MNTPVSTQSQHPLKLSAALPWFAGASASFHLAFLVPSLSFLIIIFLFAALQLVRLRGNRLTFYFGLALGFSIYGPHLAFFWTIFGPAAIALWGVVSFWLALFLLLARATVQSFGRTTAVIFVPVIWLGLEYFRGELYYLRFSWLTPGFAFSENLPWLILKWLGVHGIGALACLAAAALLWLKRPWGHVIGGAIALLLLSASTPFPVQPAETRGSRLRVAGVQLEFQPADQVLAELDKTFNLHPDTDLFVLSEYTIPDELPDQIKQWCREKRRHLIIGAKDRLSPDQPIRGNDYFNTAFVIDPEGNVVFRQAKSVPIQFFQDGQPAPERKVWESPWGKIGIAVCYDLSYSRVMDDLVGLGAEALIVPTMDLLEWGEYAHRLHSRVTPIRAAEYRLPIFRLASSGISQSVDAQGRVRHTAPFPGQGEVIAGELLLAGRGYLPSDRFLGPPAVAVTALVALACLVTRLRSRRPDGRTAFRNLSENPVAVPKRKPASSENVSVQPSPQRSP